MIQRDIDRGPVLEEFGFEIGETIDLSRQQILEFAESLDDFFDKDWAELLNLFFQKLAQNPNIEGVAISSLPNEKIHVDYFCKGENGIEMSGAISTIEGVKSEIGDTPCSIWWLDRHRTFDQIEKVFKSKFSVNPDNHFKGGSNLEQSELLLLVHLV